MVATVPTFYKQTARLFFCETLGILKNTRIFGGVEWIQHPLLKL